MGEFEATLAPFDGAGEGALLVAEDLALEQRLGDGRAVDRHVGHRHALAQLMDGLGDHLLAGARFAGDQHRGGRGRRLFDGAVDLPHHRGVADHAAEAALLAKLAAQFAQFAEGVLAFGRLAQQDFEPLHVDRFRQVVVGAFLDGFDRRFDGPLRRQQDDGEIAQLIAQHAQEGEAIHVRHDEIGDDDRRPEGRDLLERIFTVAGTFGVIAPGPDQFGQAVERAAIVFYDQHAFGQQVVSRGVGRRRSVVYLKHVNLSDGHQRSHHANARSPGKCVFGGDEGTASSRSRRNSGRSGVPCKFGR